MKVELSHIKFDEEKVKQIRDEQITNLAASIKQFGLLHPVTVQSLNDSGEYRLVAGLQRLLAHFRLGEEQIEVDVVEAKDLLAAEEMSLHENIKRHNLEWWQEALLVKDYHDLKQKQVGAAPSKGGRPRRDTSKGWSLRDTARELGMSLGDASQKIDLAKEVMANPSLRNIKDQDTARRLVKVQAKRITQEEEQGAPSNIAEGLEPNQVYHGDSSEVLKMLPDLSFDACITDPPWLAFRGVNQLEKDEKTNLVFREIFRVLKFNTVLYAFVGIDDFSFYKHWLPTLGFKVSKTPLIWVKTGSMSPLGVAPWEYGRDFEFILLAAKGSPVLTNVTQQSSIFSFPIVPPKRMIHPHEKPIPLLQKIIKDCTYENAMILDPFAGSGATLEATEISRRSFVGIERNHEFYVNICKRLGKKVDDGSNDRASDRSDGPGGDSGTPVDPSEGS